MTKMQIVNQKIMKIALVYELYEWDFERKLWKVTNNTELFPYRKDAEKRLIRLKQSENHDRVIVNSDVHPKWVTE